MSAWLVILGIVAVGVLVGLVVFRKPRDNRRRDRGEDRSGSTVTAGEYNVRAALRAAGRHRDRGDDSSDSPDSGGSGGGGDGGGGGGGGGGGD
jgi:hypothetical protein